MVDWESREEGTGEGLTHHIDYCESVVRLEKRERERERRQQMRADFLYKI